MANHLETEPNPAVATLVNGIVQDAHELVTEQFKLFQVEIKNHLRKAGSAAVPLVLGVLISLAGLTSLALAGGYLLSWAVPALPLWAALSLVGGGVLVAGAGLALWGKCQLAACNSEPDAAEAMKESLPWKTKN